jgi:hypothetical protein
MKLKEIRMMDADQAIRERKDFGVKATAWARENLDVVYSLRGYAPLPNVGCHEPELNERRALPAEYFREMVADMQRRKAAYIVESYNTVIAWVDADGGVHIPPFRHSLTTTQHQHTASYALKGRSFFWAETERSELSYAGTIGRRGY